jgi:hypothetical protein
MINSANESFLVTLSKSDLKDVAINIADLSFDALLEEGLFKEIPFVGWIFQLNSARIAISDKIFAKKVMSFLSELGSISLSDREELFNKLEKNGKRRQEVGESILVIINHAESFEKAKYLGVLMRSLSKNIIDFDEFIRFSSILNHAIVGDLREIILFQNSISHSAGSSLQSFGLVISTGYFENKEHDENLYKISRRGIKFYEAFEGFR